MSAAAMYHLAITEPDLVLREAYRTHLVRAVIVTGNVVATYMGTDKKTSEDLANGKSWYWIMPGCVMWSDSELHGPGGDSSVLDRAHAAAYYQVKGLDVVQPPNWEKLGDAHSALYRGWQLTVRDGSFGIQGVMSYANPDGSGGGHVTFQPGIRLRANAPFITVESMKEKLVREVDEQWRPA